MDTIQLSNSVLWRISQLADRMALSGRIPSPAALITALVGSMEAAGMPLRLSREKPAGHGFSFVSSSIREGSTAVHAMDGLNSPTFKHLERDTPGGRSGIGFWSDGAEESRIVPTGDPETARHLGQKYNQKAVISFMPHAGGKDTAHVLIVPHDDPFHVYSVLQSHGVPFATIAPHKTGSVVYVIGDVPDAAVAALRAKHKAIAGTATFQEEPNGGRMKLARKADYSVPTGRATAIPGTTEGINAPRKIGRWFVKQVKNAGSPYAEEAASKLRDHLGLPSLRMKHAEDKHGRKFVFTNYEGNLPTIDHYEARSQTPVHPTEHTRVVDNLLADYLTADDDRHGSNYVDHPVHGWLSIDHGQAFHPLNADWAASGVYPADFADSAKHTSIIHQEPNRNSRAIPDPADSYLFQTAGRGVLSATATPEVVQKAISPAHERRLMQLAWEGTEDLPREERLAATRAMLHRVRVLRAHVAKHGTGTITGKQLVDAAHEARDSYKPFTMRPTPQE